MSLVLKHAAQLAGVTAPGELRRTGGAMRQVGVIADGAVVIDGGRIAWLGPTRDLPEFPPDADVLDVSGKAVIPGFVDSHTHLIFAGDRADEWERRLAGESYQQIAAAGGGIMSTVRAVRGASREQLKSLARPRLRRLLHFGVTTAEVKSGYGLSVADEVRCLEAVRELDAEGPLELIPTFLGAHAVPQEYRSDRAAYVRLVCEEMLPEVAKSRLARFCDVFCEAGVFDLGETERVLRAGERLGLGIKVHADELTCLDGAVLAAKLGAASADHFLCVSEQGIDALAASGTVATLLPMTALFLDADFAPARKLIDRGATVALASDCNPGTCPSENLPFAGALACMAMGMLPGEALHALTLNAACALGVSDRVGSLAVGKQADLLVCDVSDYRHLFYHFGVNHVVRVIKRGRLVWATTPPAREALNVRPDDPRVGESVEFFGGDLASLRPGRPVLIGFPQDEGVRRNGGRVGAALAPAVIRRWLYRLSDWGADLLDLGDLVVSEDLESSQESLGRIVAELLRRGCVPVVLGGGHETAYGTYLGYVGADLDVSVINIDAHLDVRPPLDGRGHSGSPFRQMMEHPTRQLPGQRYHCLGAQPANTSPLHREYVRQRGGEVVWADEVRSRLVERIRERFASAECPLHVSLDADVARASDVPGVSAPAPIGLAGDEIAEVAMTAGRAGAASFELVEINPTFDIDGRSARWAAVVVWNFVTGLARRGT